MMGFAFNRQKPIKRYIVDFYCKKLKLVIEIDGCSHYHEDVYLNDIQRQKALEELDLQFLRFDDIDVKRNIAHVLRTIENFIIDSGIQPNQIPLRPLKRGICGG